MKTFKELKEEITRINNIDHEGFDGNWVLRKFARDQALINIKLIKPYTDKYDLIVRFLVTGKDAHAATGAADATPTDSADSADSAADAAFDSAYEAASASDANAADAAYYTAVYADTASYYAANADAATYAADYTKAIESLNTLANEYLVLINTPKLATASPPSLSADDAGLIAKKYVPGLMTLEAQNSDELDFHTVAVWSIEDMLNDAYKKGLAAAVKPVVEVDMESDSDSGMGMGS